MKLHTTYSSNQYYAAFTSLPKTVRDLIKSTDIEIECSRYTVGQPTAFIRLSDIMIEIDGEERVFDIEISLGSFDINSMGYDWSDELHSYVYENGDEVDEEAEAEVYLNELHSVTEFEGLNVYLTEVQ